MKKLLIDGRMFSSSFTGIGRYTAEIVAQMQHEELPFLVVLFLNTKEAEKFEVKNPHLIVKIADEKIYSFAEQTSFLQKLKKENADLLWVPHFNVPFFYTLPFFCTIHDLTLSRYPGKGTSFVKKIIYHTILRHAMKRAQCIFSVSQNTKKDLVFSGITPEKIEVIGNGISPEFLNFQPIPSFVLENFGITKPYFFYSGNWKEHKNITRLVDAFAAFIKKNGEVAQLVLSGKPEQKILEYVAEKKLRHLVRTVGMISENDLLHLYHNAKIFVFPSLYEGFGLPLLEAMAMGIPVISSSTPALKEIGENAALFFDPLSVEEMSNAMETVFFDEDFQQKLKQQGFLQAQKFSWKQSSKAHLESIKKFLV